jgi:MinD superfamily P-loop ATPase
MRKIAISGGKGGTGKSTVAILFANQLVKEGKKVILCDCDVECPNDYLLIGQKLKKPIKKIFTEFPKLNKKKCTKCGLCVKTCRNNAIFQAPGEYPTFIKDLCSGCGACWTVCPYGAIEREKEETGKIYLNKIQNPKSKIQNFYLVTGTAKSKLEETGPVVKEVKDFALDFAQKIKADYILFDTAAGTHCPVISALLDCDLVYVVTEPTPMGAHDLDLILDLIHKLKLKAKVILNQANLGDKKIIEEIAKKFKIKIEKEIPYSKKLVNAYSKGQLLNFGI